MGGELPKTAPLGVDQLYRSNTDLLKGERFARLLLNVGTNNEVKAMQLNGMIVATGTNLGGTTNPRLPSLGDHIYTSQQDARKNNQDGAINIFGLEHDYDVMAVIDGAGGHANGELAAAIILDSIDKNSREGVPDPVQLALIAQGNFYALINTLYLAPARVIEAKFRKSYPEDFDPQTNALIENSRSARILSHLITVNFYFKQTGSGFYQYRKFGEFEQEDNYLQLADEALEDMEFEHLLAALSELSSPLDYEPSQNSDILQRLVWKRNRMRPFSITPTQANTVKKALLAILTKDTDMKVNFDIEAMLDARKTTLDAFRGNIIRADGTTNLIQNARQLAAAGVIVVSYLDQLHFANIGDTRLYLYSQDTLSQISTDETLAAKLQQLSANTIEEAFSYVLDVLGKDSWIRSLVDQMIQNYYQEHADMLQISMQNFRLEVLAGKWNKLKPLIVQSVIANTGNVLENSFCGLPMEENEVQSGMINFALGDILLLCSDGLTKHVGDWFISHQLEMVSRGKISAETAVKELIMKAKLNGGRDNITATVVQKITEDVST